MFYSLSMAALIKVAQCTLLYTSHSNWYDSTSSLVLSCDSWYDSASSWTYSKCKYNHDTHKRNSYTYLIANCEHRFVLFLCTFSRGLWSTIFVPQMLLPYDEQTTLSLSLAKKYIVNNNQNKPNMNSSVRLISSSITRTSVVPRVVTALGATRSMTVGGSFAKKVSYFQPQKSVADDS